jgi:hypothetical protein
MKGYVAITDREWFEFLSQRPEIDEVNFWQPGGSTSFKALSVGQPFLFKLHAPDNRIVGGGYYTAFSRLPISLAWEAFGEQNGVASLDEMRERTAKYRRVTPDPHEDYTIGCIILSNPFFFDRPTQFPQPHGFQQEHRPGQDLRFDPGHRQGALGRCPVATPRSTRSCCINSRFARLWRTQVHRFFRSGGLPGKFTMSTN